jgi:hypothetical protein
LFANYVGFNRIHAWWSGDLSGSDIKCTVVEITFNIESIQVALTQRSWPMTTKIIESIKIVFDLEQSDIEAVDTK